MALLSSVSPSGKLLNLRVAPAAGVTSEGGLGELPNLAILLFSLLKTVQSSGQQQGLRSQTSLCFKSVTPFAS